MGKWYYFVEGGGDRYGFGKYDTVELGKSIKSKQNVHVLRNCANIEKSNWCHIYVEQITYYNLVL